MRVLRPRHALSQTATRVTYRFETTDTRLYYLNHVVNRMRQAVARGGGELHGGVHNLPRRIFRWTLLRSPHVNKKSREKFWMIKFRRMFHWDAPLGTVDPSLATDLADSIPASVAVRVITNAPALAELKGVYDTINTMQVGADDTPVLKEESADQEEGSGQDVGEADEVKAEEGKSETEREGEKVLS